MDVAFLTANSFMKIVEFSPTTRAANILHPKKHSHQTQFRKSPSPFSVTCCQLSYNERPSLSSDWRTFRARLVATEQMQRPADPSVAVDPETMEEQQQQQQQPPVSLRDKWAHVIHEPEKGCLLIATEKLDGVHIFERTVVLLLSEGPSGIILNRPSLMSIKETRSNGAFSNRPLFFGGPLEEGLFLVSPKGRSNDEVGRSGVFDAVMEGLYYGTKESVGCAAEMVKRNMVGVEDFRFFDGYCSWDNEQLNDEIRAGYWTLAACSPNVFGLDSVDNAGLWEEVLGLIGHKKVW